MKLLKKITFAACFLMFIAMVSFSVIMATNLNPRKRVTTEDYRVLSVLFGEDVKENLRIDRAFVQIVAMGDGRSAFYEVNIDDDFIQKTISEKILKELDILDDLQKNTLDTRISRASHLFDYQHKPGDEVFFVDTPSSRTSENYRSIVIRCEDNEDKYIIVPSVGLYTMID